LGLDYLIVYKPVDYLKIRIGTHGDGGYIICDNIDYKLLLSCGLSDDITFEIDFLKKYNVICYAFDGTINKMPQDNDKIHFIKKNISSIESITTTNMFEYINNYDDIFLKMDIETWEYSWIESLSYEQLNKIKQLVIEFHFPFTYSKEIFNNLSYPINVDDKIKCLQKISKTHYLIHLHPNNCCGTTIYNNIIVPNVFECTYIRKDLCKNIEKNNDKIPGALDVKNVINMDEIFLNGYPFCL